MRMEHSVGEAKPACCGSPLRQQYAPFHLHTSYILIQEHTHTPTPCSYPSLLTPFHNTAGSYGNLDVGLKTAFVFQGTAHFRDCSTFLAQSEMSVPHMQFMKMISLIQYKTQSRRRWELTLIYKKIKINSTLRYLHSYRGLDGLFSPKMSNYTLILAF